MREGPEIITAMQKKEKLAIVLFNLGGPDTLRSVQPFLQNLFNDKAIIALPQPFRVLLAMLISHTRAKSAQKNYALMGGKSPINKESRAQADAVEKVLRGRLKNLHIKSFISMRYWHPMIDKTQQEIEEWGADKTILVPLYPQFSTTTTGTFYRAWEKIKSPKSHTLRLPSYETNEKFIAAHVENILSCWEGAKRPKNIRVLFSAHGLPQKIVDAGDPYQDQIEKTCAAIKKHLPNALQDTRICYQSRVGPMQWIGPQTDGQIVEAGKEGKNLLVVPVAFVSEHVETLVELDIDYAKLAQESGVTHYLRVPTLSLSEKYIDCLADLIETALGREK